MMQAVLPAAMTFQLEQRTGNTPIRPLIKMIQAQRIGGAVLPIERRLAFDGPAPICTARYVDQVFADGSGDPIALAGNAFLRFLRETAGSGNEEVERQENLRRQFMMDVAHEMRTPLTTINGILEGIQHHGFSERQWALDNRQLYRHDFGIDENKD